MWRSCELWCGLLAIVLLLVLMLLRWQWVTARWQVKEIQVDQVVEGEVLLVDGVKWWRWWLWQVANQRFLRPPPTAKRPCSLSLANYAFWKSRAMRIFFKKTFHLLGGVPVADIQHHLLLSCCIGDVRMWFKWWQVWEQGFLGKGSLITFAKG